MLLEDSARCDDAQVGGVPFKLAGLSRWYSLHTLLNTGLFVAACVLDPPYGWLVVATLLALGVGGFLLWVAGAGENGFRHRLCESPVLCRGDVRWDLVPSDGSPRWATALSYLCFALLTLVPTVLLVPVALGSAALGETVGDWTAQTFFCGLALQCAAHLALFHGWSLAQMAVDAWSRSDREPAVLVTARGAAPNDRGVILVRPPRWHEVPLSAANPARNRVRFFELPGRTRSPVPTPMLVGARFVEAGQTYLCNCTEADAAAATYADAMGPDLRRVSPFLSNGGALTAPAPMLLLDIRMALVHSDEEKGTAEQMVDEHIWTAAQLPLTEAAAPKVREWTASLNALLPELLRAQSRYDEELKTRRVTVEPGGLVSVNGTTMRVLGDNRLVPAV